MTKFADQWEPNGPFGIVTDSNMSGGYRVVTNDADKTDITILPPERQKVGMLVYVSATGKTWRLTTVGVRNPGAETYSSAPVFVDVSGGGIGNSVAGGAATRVLFIGADGLLAQSPDFTYTGSQLRLDADGSTFIAQNGQMQLGGGLWFDGAEGSIYRQSYGGLYIGNDSNVSVINIGTAGNDDSVVIGREEGPDTYVNSALRVTSALTVDGVDAYVYTPRVDATASTSTLSLGVGTVTTGITLGRSGHAVDVPGILNASGVINANGGIGISSGSVLDIGNDNGITTGINIGTVSAQGVIKLGSALITQVDVTPVLNANGHIATSTTNHLNIGNVSNITAGINIGTSNATGTITIGRGHSGDVFINSQTIALDNNAQDVLVKLGSDGVGVKEIRVGSADMMSVGYLNGLSPYAYISMPGANAVCATAITATNSYQEILTKRVLPGWYRVRITVLYTSTADTSALTLRVSTGTPSGLTKGYYVTTDDTEKGLFSTSTSFEVTGSSISNTGLQKIQIHMVVRLSGAARMSLNVEAKTNVAGAELAIRPGAADMEMIGIAPESAGA